MSNIQQPQYNNRRQSQIYTHHIPYGIRKDVCNLLDADQSWRTLGGQFVGLDATQLTLLGQAYMRGGSPTDELLIKLDSANVRITDFCSYLKQMNHCRALETLKPFLMEQENNTQDITMSSSRNSTLETPTPSFADLPPAIMGLNDTINQFDFLVEQQQQQFILPANAKNDNISNQEPEPTLTSRCHKTTTTTNQAIQQEPKQQLDPGEEIVRMACANNKKRTSISDQEVVNQLRLIMQITYNELKQASNNFSDLNILGNGGFASVYRGNWKGTDVAIKRLKCNLMDQALNELTILNSYRIDNILPIYGISIDGPEACLVYQFMSNGSLEDRLSCKKGTAPLTWNQRALIGEGVAKGLYYLHTLRDKPLVHGDVKSANVLLDSQFVPKLGDFGLARQVFKGKNLQTELCTHCTVSSIHGTSVYLPPEYLRHKILSPAVDVYSYGIVLLEMATGRRAYDGKRLLLDVVEDETKSMSIGQIGYSLKDSRLADDTQDDLIIWFELLIKLGLNCAHKIKKKRLDMGQVLNRFADFRQNSDLVANNNFIHGSFSSNGTTTTARTLTPDLTALDRNPFQFNNMVASINNTSIAQKSNLPQKQVITQQQYNRFQVNNSSLMIVEEEGITKFNHFEEDERVKNIQLTRAQQQQNNDETSAVEDMIPLLTELGVVENEDQSNCIK